MMGWVMMGIYILMMIGIGIKRYQLRFPKIKPPKEEIRHPASYKNIRHVGNDKLR